MGAVDTMPAGGASSQVVGRGSRAADACEAWCLRAGRLGPGRRMVAVACGLPWVFRMGAPPTPDVEKQLFIIRGQGTPNEWQAKKLRTITHHTKVIGEE